MGLTLMCFVLAERRPERRRLFLASMYVAIALGFLTKGPVAVVLPGFAVLAYLGLHGRLGDVRRLMLPAGILIVALIVVPWYAALYGEYGWIHIRRFFIEENLSRYTAPYGSTAAGRGPLFYLPVLLTDLFPWSLFLPAAVWLFARDAMRHRRDHIARAAGRQLPALLLLWIGAIVGFFTLSQTKQDLYIFPAVAAIAALIGGALAPAVAARPGDDPPLVRWNGLIAGLALAAAGGAILYLFDSAARVYAIDGASATAWVAIVAGLATWGFAARRRSFHAIVTLALAALAVNGVFVTRALPSFARYQAVPAMADEIRSRAGVGARVGYYRMALPSLVYYLDRPVFEIFEPSQVIEVFSGPEVYCLMAARDYETVRETLPVPTCVLARAPFFDVKIGNVIERRPLPELLLVSNQCQ